ncbi:hypothetical protein AC1031_011874 [Aphanomyces cochlioides]|nr:hypothetical protein AC1031_011874 [Aphanomyces cochlioides]
MVLKDDLITRKNDREEQLRQVYATIEAYVPTYEVAIETLERHLQSNMTPDGAGQWFDLYVRVVDLAVEIRRGEIRHQTQRKFKYRSRTKTCHANATTNGLGIDDGNALINKLDKLYRQLKKRKPMQLDTLESQLDILDRDTIGPLDKRISECKKRMENSKSVYYTACSLTVHGDLHVELIVRQGNSIVVQKRRRCESLESCTCPIDAEPWKNFQIKPPAKAPQSIQMPKEATNVPDVNLNDLKKSFGIDVEERERNLEAFQKELQGVVIDETEESEPHAKRVRVSASNELKIDEAQTALLRAIASTFKRTANGMCQLLYNILPWGDTPSYEKMDVTTRAIDLMSLRVETWTMHDLAMSPVEMTTFASVLTEKECLRRLANLNLRGIRVKPTAWTLPLNAFATLPALQHLDLSYNTLESHGPALEAIFKKCLSLKTINLEQCRLKDAETNLLKGLAENFGQSQLKRISLADNSLSRAFLVKFFRLVADADLDTINLRYVTTTALHEEEEGNYDFEKLPVRHLHLDYSCLANDNTFVLSLAKSISNSCELLSVDMSSQSNPHESGLSELMNKLAAYGELRRLSMRGVTSMNSIVWDTLIQKGLRKCVTLECTTLETTAEKYVDSLLPDNLPVLREIHFSIETSSSPGFPSTEEWRSRLASRLPALSSIDVVVFTRKS